MALEARTLAIPYVVRTGENIQNLIRKYGFTSEAFKEFNPDVDPDHLQAGQIVLIPIR